MEKEDEERHEITEEQREDYTDERTEYRNAYDAGLERQIVTDELTGLPNRRALVDILGKSLDSLRQSPVSGLKRLNEQPQPPLEEFALLYIDLDNFKIVNDTLGHDQGDVALKETARVLTSSIRRGEVAARLHGDEFAVFLPRTTEEGAVNAAKKILENLNGDATLQKFGIGASIGVRHVGKPDLTEEMTTEALVKDADIRQAEAKRAGKGSVAVYQK